MRIALLCSILAACGWSEKRFEVVGIERFCEVAASCAGTYETATCVDVLRSTDRSDCDYDPAAAKACAQASEEAACIDYAPMDVREIAVPEDCLAVYSCEWIDLGPF